MAINWKEVLLGSRTSKEFFAETKLQLKQHHPKISYSILAEQWGMSSKSLVAEILNGKRRPTYRSFIQISRALKLTSVEKEYLKTLLAQDNPKFGGMDPKLTKTAMEKAKAKLSRQATTQMFELPLPKKMKGEHMELWPKVYAAVGKASSSVEVAALLNKAPSKIETILNCLVELKLVELRAGLYHSNEEHVHLHPDFHRKIIETFIQNELKRLMPELPRLYSEKDALLFGGAMMVKSADLPTLKQKLKKILSQFLEAHYDPKGDTIVSLISLLSK